MRDKQSELKLRVCMNKEHMEAMAISIRHERMQRDDRSHREDGENATTTATIKNRVGTRERESNVSSAHIENIMKDGQHITKTRNEIAQ